MQCLLVLCGALVEHASDPADLSWQLTAQLEDRDTARDESAPDRTAGRGPVVLLATGGAVVRPPGERFLDKVEVDQPSPLETVQNEPGLRARILDLGAATRALTSMPEVESQRFWDNPQSALLSLGPVLHSQLVAVQTHAASHVRLAAQDAGLSVPLFVMGFVAVMVATLVILSVALTPAKATGEPVHHAMPQEPTATAGAAQAQAQAQLSSRLSARHSARSPWNVLCRELVVPHGNEFLFAMKSCVLREPQQDSFEVVDPDNFGFCSVVLAERGEPAFHGMQGILLRVRQQPLAFLDTSPLFQRRSTGQLPSSRRALAGDSIQLPIYRSSREVFGTFQLEGDVPRRYGVRVEGTLLMSFHGDFRESAVTVHNAQGQLIATTEKHTFAFSLDPHIQVRAAQLVDTSVLMLGLLAAAKME